MKISSLIYNRRMELGMTQEELSKKLGYQTPQFISILERGKALLPLHIVNKLSRILEVDYDELNKMAMNEKIERLR